MALHVPRGFVLSQLLEEAFEELLRGFIEGVHGGFGFSEGSLGLDDQSFDALNEPLLGLGDLIQILKSEAKHSDVVFEAIHSFLVRILSCASP